jgi:hypothetical protein
MRLKLGVRDDDVNSAVHAGGGWLAKVESLLEVRALLERRKANDDMPHGCHLILKERL